MSDNKKRQIILTGFLAVFLAAVIAGCSSTEQRSVTESGFLKNYSDLKKGTDGEARLYYVKPGVNWNSYQKVIIDPVQFWVTKSKDQIPKKDQTILASYAQNALNKDLGAEFQIVTQPGPGTLRIRTAITEADAANVPLDIVTTVVPQALVLGEVKDLATGTRAFVGKAQAEVEIVDSVTGVRLAAAVDARAGGKSLEGVTNEWRDVEQACNTWAQMIATRIQKLRAGSK